MTKQQLIDRTAQRGGTSKSVAKLVVDLVFESMTRALVKEGRVDLRGFGNFSAREYSGYTGINPRSKAKVEVKPRRLAYFKAAKKINERLSAK
jgi:integration host factor subunit beta